VAVFVVRKKSGDCFIYKSSRVQKWQMFSESDRRGVVLGRGEEFRKQRVDVARELWHARRAPRIFTSGRGDAASMIEQRKAKGIPIQVLDGENCSLTTWQNAVFTAATLHPQEIRRILLVTDERHMLRSLLVFRANSFIVIPHTTPLPPSFGFKATAFLTFREYMG
jgi:uncharacterized SAM-binding protein YcdF (DUF218 family)